MKYEYHTRLVMEELRGLAELAERCLAEYGPGTPPNIALLREQFAYTGVLPEVAEGLCKVAAMVAVDPVLTALYSAMLDMPRLHQHHDQVTGAMQALIFLSATADVRAKHATMGIPDEITRDTVADVNVALKDYARNHDGALGSDYTNWLINHYTFKLYKIGRLQYILKPFDGNVRVFINDTAGEIILTAKSGVAFRGDGLIDGQNNIFSPETRWLSKCDEDDAKVVTNCLFTNGHAVRTPLALDKSVWRVVLESGMNVLDMHIPEGPSLTQSACTESMRAACRFFDHYFSDRPIETFYCGSWLLDAEMQSFLPPLSGIVQFQKLFHIYPEPGSDREFIYRVFDIRRSDVKAALDDVMAFAKSTDRSTALRRGIADHWLAGGRFHPAGGVTHRSKLFPPAVQANRPRNVDIE